MAQLQAQLAAAISGNATLTLLTGSAGMGKTRTASELAARTREAGVRVLTCAAFEGETSAPYWPYTQLLRQARDQLTADGFAKHLPMLRLAIGSIVPELGSAPVAKRVAATEHELRALDRR